MVDRMASLLAAAPVANDGQLQRIAQLIAEEDDTQRELETAEALAQNAKDRLRELRHKSLPEAMLAAGTTNFTTDQGIQVKLEFMADGALGSPKTPAEYQERERKMDIIAKHGGEEIIQMSVTASFPKGLFGKADALLAKVAAWVEKAKLPGVKVEKLRTIHHQTLKKWVRECMEDGEHENRFGAPLPLEDLGIWYGQIAKVKRPKNNSEEKC